MARCTSIAHRICAAEFEEHPIARGLDDITAVLGNLAIDQLLADLAQAGERARIVALHVTAEPDHVGNENRGEPAGDASIDGHPSVSRPDGKQAILACQCSQHATMFTHYGVRRFDLRLD